jgi:hypothetical protein
MNVGGTRNNDCWSTVCQRSSCITIGSAKLSPLSSTTPLALARPPHVVSHKDTAVVNAARSLLKIFRQRNPHVLRSKDRGRQWKIQDEVCSCVCAVRRWGAHKQS